MKGSSMKRMVKKRGAMPNRVMKNPALNATRRPNKPMMADHNGWANYETWLTALWWGQTELSMYIEDQWGSDVSYDQEYDIAQDIQNYVEEYIKEAMPDQGGYAQDMLNAAMEKVNWREITNSVIDTIKE